MKLRVDRLGTTPSHFAFTADNAWWEQTGETPPGLPARLPEPLAVGVDAYLAGEDLILELSLDGGIETECSRCLARYRHALRERVRLVLEPAGLRRPSDPEAARALQRDGMCLGEEGETGWYRGDEIDLSGFLREWVILGWPVQPLCREDCAGLCGRCGSDLNRGPCACPPLAPESPFAALQGLRERIERGE